MTPAFVSHEQTLAAGTPGVVRSDVRTLWGDARVSANRHCVLPGHQAPALTDFLVCVLDVARRPGTIVRRLGGDRAMIVPAHSGVMFVSPSHVDTFWSWDVDVDAFNFVLPAKTLARFAEEHDLPGVGLLNHLVGGFRSPLVDACIRRGRHLAASEEPAALLREQLIVTILAELWQLGGGGLASGHPVRGGLAPWQVRRVTDYLEDRLADDVTLGDLGELLGLSSFHVCRAFKQSTGLPPQRWRHQRRMERARELLEGTNLSITAIAASVGYDDPSRFASGFRKAFGLSPTDYRRERRW